MTNPSREYRLRQELQTRRIKYREAAQRLFPTATVSPHAHVGETIDKHGAFVEIVVWVPKEEIVIARRIDLKHHIEIDGKLCKSELDEKGEPTGKGQEIESKLRRGPMPWDDV